MYFGNSEGEAFSNRIRLSDSRPENEESHGQSDVCIMRIGRISSQGDCLQKFTQV